MDTLFSLPELPSNKFEPEPISQSERRAKLSKAIKLNELVRDEAPQTSVDAAIAAKQTMTGREQELIDLLSAHPEGLNIYEMTVLTGKEKGHFSPRTARLKKLGIIYEDGVRPTNNNRMGTVYKLS